MSITRRLYNLCTRDQTWRPATMGYRTEQMQDGLSIRLLGGFQAAVDGQPVAETDWATRQAAGLGKMLALAPGRHRQREQAMDARWPDLGHEAARRNLRKALHFARHALHPSAQPSAHPFLRAKGDLLLLVSPPSLWVDV